ncbi:MAG: DUF370 domain-containing protein [Ruminococcus sp.]|jgi:hypothetical protein|nr:DUF370 domain-containing protein [Ruminococcus sp.]
MPEKMKRIHLGEGVFISDTETVGIFDIEKTSTRSDTKNYLRGLGRNAVTITYDMPKSFLVTTDKTYISKLATAVLARKFIP